MGPALYYTSYIDEENGKWIDNNLTVKGAGLLDPTTENPQRNKVLITLEDGIRTVASLYMGLDNG